MGGIRHRAQGARHRAWGYAVGGWRSASLEVGGTIQQAARVQKTEVGGQKSEIRGKIVD